MIYQLLVINGYTHVTIINLLMLQKVHRVTMRTVPKAHLSSETGQHLAQDLSFYIFAFIPRSAVLHPLTYMFSAITENCITCGTGCYVFFLLATPFGPDFTVVLGPSDELLKTGCTFNL